MTGTGNASQDARCCARRASFNSRSITQVDHHQDRHESGEGINAENLHFKNPLGAVLGTDLGFDEPAAMYACICVTQVLQVIMLDLCKTM